MTTIPLPAGYRSPFFTARPSRAGYGGRAATAIRGGTIRPYVVPWTKTVDDFGVAIPASDCVGVVTNYVLPTSGDPDYPLDSDYATDIREMLDKNAYAVPKVLPSGYTSRLLRDAWATSGESYCAHAQMVSGLTGSTAVYQRNANGRGSALYWRPAMALSAATSPGNAFTPFDPGFAILTGYHHGWRKVRVRLGCPSFGPPWYISGGVIGGARFSHNADGSAVTGAYTDGDTTDATVSFSPSDFTWNGSIWQTGWKDVAAPLWPTHGHVTRFYVRDLGSAPTVRSYIQFTLDPPFGPDTTIGQPYLLDLQESYRVDIPFPFTATGEGGLIAPGGIVIPA